MSDPAFRGFLDESSANRGPDRQEYLVCAALLPADVCADAREELQPLRSPGRAKLHWAHESERRRREIVARIVDLGPLNVVISHVDLRRRRTERYRRKSLELLYHELVAMDVFHLTLECRSGPQDKGDRAHIVALRGQGLDRRLHIDHLRGGDEPLLWIADAVLGAVNAAHLGETSHLDALRATLLLVTRTSESLASTEEAVGLEGNRPGQDERP